MTRTRTPTRQPDLWPFMAWFTVRFGELIDVAHLATLRVGILGLGIIGGPLADLLARVGVGALTLADRGAVEVPNLRSFRSLQDVGKPKLEAVRRALSAINPGLRVTCVAGDIDHASDEELRLFARSVDVLVNVVDAFPTLERVNAVAYEHVPTVHSAIVRRGAAGEVIWTKPGQTPCMSCCTNAAARREAGRSSNFQALPLDALPVVGVTAQVVLGLLLEGRQGGELFQNLLNPARNLILVANRKDGWLFDELPSEIVSAVVTVDTTSVQRQCSICGP